MEHPADARRPATQESRRAGRGAGALAGRGDAGPVARAAALLRLAGRELRALLEAVGHAVVAAAGSAPHGESQLRPLDCGLR